MATKEEALEHMKRGGIAQCENFQYRLGPACVQWIDPNDSSDEWTLCAFNRRIVDHYTLLPIEDAAAHAAELEAKDKRIRELEAEREAKDKRIVALLAELAKRELPPLPESVRRVVDEMREQLMCAVVNINAYRARELITWVDTHYPATVPQWERDAQYLEAKLGGETRSAYSPDEIKAIAARIREAGRGNSK